jgi:hypothetical protein
VEKGLGVTNQIAMNGRCGGHSHFHICDCCGIRGNYCFVEPLTDLSAAALEAVLEAIEALDPPDKVFMTREVWRQSYFHYGLVARILKWLQFLNFIERLPGPPQAGNKWRRVI